MILVFGKTGQVAKELQRASNVLALGRDEADLSKPQICGDAIRAYRPTVVINAAAYTAVDHAEEEAVFANVINGEAPAAMARACTDLDIPLVNISTDYVFKGHGTAPWRPSDPTEPQNAYGESKLLGEVGIRASGANHVILRTSWVVSSHGANFVKSMLRLSQTRDKLSIVDDQIGGPTPAHEIASACLQIAKQMCQDPSKSGTYHFSGAPDVSWADFAMEIFERAGRRVMINPIPTADYPTPAARPLNSRMDCRSTETVFGLSRPDWRKGLDTIITELEEDR